MKDLNYFLIEGSKYKFKKGDLVKIHKDWKDDPKEDFTYELLDNPDGGRVMIRAIDTKLSIPPVENVKLEMIVPKEVYEGVKPQDSFYIRKDNKFLTNHGMKKFWFTDNEQFAYSFDTEIEAQRMAKVEGGEVVTYDDVFNN